MNKKNHERKHNGIEPKYTHQWSYLHHNQALLFLIKKKKTNEDKQWVEIALCFHMHRIRFGLDWSLIGSPSPPYWQFKWNFQRKFLMEKSMDFHIVFLWIYAFVSKSGPKIGNYYGISRKLIPVQNYVQNSKMWMAQITDCFSHKNCVDFSKAKGE